MKSIIPKLAEFTYIDGVLAFDEVIAWIEEARKAGLIVQGVSVPKLKALRRLASRAVATKPWRMD